MGATGVVYGVDIQQEMLDLLAKRMAMFRITNVKPVLGEITDPKLPPESCDTMIMVDVYHEFDHPYEMIANMLRGLKPGGRHRLRRVSRGGSEGADQGSAQDERGAGEEGDGGASALEFVENIGDPAVAAHHRFSARPARRPRSACCTMPTSRAALLTRPAAK